MPFPAGTVTSAAMHGPPLMGAGCPTVLIGNKPAWRVTDTHTCSVPNAPPPAGPGTPHGPGVTIPPGCVTVMAGGPMLTSNLDQVMEPGAVVPPLTVNMIMMGFPTVLAP